MAKFGPSHLLNTYATDISVWISELLGDSNRRHVWMFGWHWCFMNRPQGRLEILDTYIVKWGVFWISGTRWNMARFQEFCHFCCCCWELLGRGRMIHSEYIPSSGEINVKVVFRNNCTQLKCLASLHSPWSRSAVYKELRYNGLIWSYNGLVYSGW